jgi:exodeoxyribonuclease VII large subunit
MRLFDPETTLTVGELTTAITRVVEAGFPDEVWVRGEISGLSRSRNDHVYFDLVEPAELGDGARPSLSVALFSGNRRTVNTQLKRAGVSGLRMEDGLEIRIRGRVQVHRNRVQLVMSGIDPEYTLGRLTADKDRLLKALLAEGLLDRNARVPVPAAPRRVALVTSARSAACQDFLHELEGSGLGWHVRVIDVRVQGEHAEQHLVAGLRTAERWDADVIALVRGGGARTDLMAFDAEVVARAIAAASLPVFTGVGHEVDHSVADEVAHLSLKTPTACAAELVDRVRAFVERTDARATELHRRALRTLERQDQRLRTTATSCAHRGIRSVERQAREVDRHATAIARLGPRAVVDAGRRLDAIDAQVRALDPERALRRGWTITRDGSGRVVRSTGQVAPGDVLVTQLADGSVRSTVEEDDDAGA